MFDEYLYSGTIWLFSLDGWTITGYTVICLFAISLLIDWWNK